MCLPEPETTSSSEVVGRTSLRQIVGHMDSSVFWALNRLAAGQAPGATALFRALGSFPDRSTPRLLQSHSQQNSPD